MHVRIVMRIVPLALLISISIALALGLISER